MSQKPYSIRGTKKGALPITVEKRPKGKVVTVIANVTGDSKALLHDLQLAAGTGGTAYADKIELQGNHESLAESLLRKKKCLQGVAKPAEVPSKKDVRASSQLDHAKQVRFTACLFTGAHSPVSHRLHPFSLFAPVRNGKYYPVRVEVLSSCFDICFQFISLVVAV